MITKEAEAALQRWRDLPKGRRDYQISLMDMTSIAKILSPKPEADAFRQSFAVLVELLKALEEEPKP